MANEARADEVMKSLQKTFGTKKKKKDDNGDGFISGKMDDGKLKSFQKVLVSKMVAQPTLTV